MRMSKKQLRQGYRLVADLQRLFESLHNELAPWIKDNLYSMRRLVRIVRTADGWVPMLGDRPGLVAEVFVYAAVTGEMSTETLLQVALAWRRCGKYDPLAPETRERRELELQLGRARAADSNRSHIGADSQSPDGGDAAA